MDFFTVLIIFGGGTICLMIWVGVLWQKGKR